MCVDTHMCDCMSQDMDCNKHQLNQQEILRMKETQAKIKSWFFQGNLEAQISIPFVYKYLQQTYKYYTLKFDNLRIHTPCNK